MPESPPPPAALRQLVYTSSAHVRHVPKDLEDILTVSRPRNRAAGVTGLLLYYENHFLQCLEGPPGAVESTMARIRRDPRHQHVTVFVNTPVAARSFAQWDMACTELSASHWLQLATAEWERHRPDPEQAPQPAPGLALLMNVWDDVKAAQG